MVTRWMIYRLIERELKMRVWLNRVPGWINTKRDGPVRIGDGVAGWESWLGQKGLPVDAFWDPRMVETQLGP
jgi:ribosomal protein L16/L10AE